LAQGRNTNLFRDKLPDGPYGHTGTYPAMGSGARHCPG